MKRVFTLQFFALLFISLICCYIPKRTTDKFGLLLSPEIGANKYFGSAIGVCGDYAFVGDPNVDVLLDPAQPDTSLRKEGGCVYILHFNSAASKWEYLRYKAPDAEGGSEGAGDIVSFTPSDCQNFDAFGSSIYFAQSDSDPTKRYLLVTSLLADTAYGTYTETNNNNGAVYLYTIPSTEELDKIQQTKFENRDTLFFYQETAKISLDGEPIDNFLPKLGSPLLGCNDIKENEAINGRMINPGIGFGYTVRMDIDNERIIVGAPYESYYKALHGEGEVLMSYVGAVYVFSPTSAGDFTDWALNARLMPMWGKPLYDETKYYDYDGTYLGTSAKEIKVGDVIQTEIRCDDRTNYYFGENIAIDGETIVVGVPSAPFQYFRESAGGVPSDGKYYDENRTEIAKPDGLKKYTEVNEAMGTIYVFKYKGSEWEFDRRCDRCQEKFDNPIAQQRTKPFSHSIPGMYMKDNDDFYQYGYYDGEKLGIAVEIYKDYIIAGIPKRDYGITGHKNIGINRVFSDIGAIAFIPVNYTPRPEKFEVSTCQLVRMKSSEEGAPYHVVDSTIRNNDDPFWGENFVRRGEILAVASPGTDYLTLQWTCGSVNFYTLDMSNANDPASVMREVGQMITVKELYKGEQTLGRWMDFSPENRWIICGLPGFGMNVYYNNPYVQKYWLPNCGSLYTFKWDK